MERWASVPGYEGAYQVSDLGRVRSIDRLDARGRRVRGRVLRPAPRGGRSPYLAVALSDGAARSFAVHTLVALAFIGPRPSGQEVRHLNGDHADSRLRNLAYGTSAENKRDTLRHGTHANASKTECVNGHAYTAANTYTYPDGRRECRTCRAVRSRAQHVP